LEWVLCSKEAEGWGAANDFAEFRDEDFLTVIENCVEAFEDRLICEVELVE
jgi:hypothetical protein